MMMAGENTNDPVNNASQAMSADMNNAPVDNGGQVQQTAPMQGNQAQPEPQNGMQDEADDGFLGSQTTEEPENPEGQPEQSPVLGAPEGGYHFENFNPENLGVSMFSEAAKELNLSQDAANTLLNKSFDGLQQHMKQERIALRKAALADRELGIADNAVRTNVNKAFDRYFGGNQQLVAKMKAINLDVDPAFLSALKRLGADISEGGTFVQGNGGSSSTDFRTFYKNTKMNR